MRYILNITLMEKYEAFLALAFSDNQFLKQTPEDYENQNYKHFVMNIGLGARRGNRQERVPGVIGRTNDQS